MTDVLPTGEEGEEELSELDEVDEDFAEEIKKDSPLSETIEQSSIHSDDSPQKGWPLLPPFIKFIQGFVDLNIEDVLFPEES